MTSEETAKFRDEGYLLLPRAVTKQVLEPVKAHVLQEVKRRTAASRGKARSRSGATKRAPPFKQVMMMTYPALEERLMSAALLSAMQELAGGRLVREQGPQLLISIPSRAEWTLDGLNWHRDLAESTPGRIPGIQAFILVDDVQPKGGGTLALAGSHRVARYRSMKPGAASQIMLDGKGFEVVEMSGRAGDAYVMDMRVIHTPSINASKTMRMIATMRYYVS